MRNFLFILSIVGLLATNLNAQQTPKLEVNVRQMPSTNEGSAINQPAPRQDNARYPSFSSEQSNQSPANYSNSSNQERVEQTLAIIKPDAVEANHIGDILSRYEQKGLRIAGIKMVQLNKDQASQFYHVHRNRPFYPELVDFMSSGPVIVLALEGQDAIAKNRQLMGATDPKKAAPGTIRADYAQSVSKNAIHGSDSPEAAQTEILFFFKPNEIFSRY